MLKNKNLQYILFTAFWLPFGIIILLYGGLLNADSKPVLLNEDKTIPPFLLETSHRAKSMLKNLSLEQKIGQMLIINAIQNGKQLSIDELTNLVSKNHVGGIIFHHDSVFRQTELLNTCQLIAEVPIFIAVDSFWNFNSQLQKFPNAQALGAITNEATIYELGKFIGKEHRAAGINMVFNPSLNVISTISNQQIKKNSFGELANNVAIKGFSLMAGLQSEKVIAVAGHFPGHGNTKADSKNTLPIMASDYNYLDSIDLYPFKHAINNGLSAVLTGHLSFPLITNHENSVSSLLPELVHNILLDSLNFRGLVIADNLDSKALLTHGNREELAIKALLAGNDMVVSPANVAQTINRIKIAVEKGEILETEINTRVLKILEAKDWLGILKNKAISSEKLSTANSEEEAELLNRRLIENSLTLVKNEHNLLPILRPDTLNSAAIAIGTNEITEFQNFLNTYTKTELFSLRFDDSKTIFNAMNSIVSKYNLLHISIHITNDASANFGISTNAVRFINMLASKTKVTLTIFGNPEALNLFEINKIQVVLLAYTNTPVSNELAAQLVFGGIPARGRLPITLGKHFPAGFGIDTETTRLKFTVPLELDLNSEILSRIDTIINEAIKNKVMPGAQIVFAKDGKIFYRKSFGHFTYDTLQQVSNSDIYDLASLTKILATTPTIMRMYEQGQIDLDAKLSNYITVLDTTDKNEITIRQVLAHHTAMAAFIPFYIKTLKNKKPNPHYYQSDSSELFSIKVAENLYLHKAYSDTLFTRVYNSKSDGKKIFRYSDIGFYILQKIIEETNKKPIDLLVQSNFYGPLGLSSIRYNPLYSFEKERIVPTENDKTFRNQLIQGYVHDFGAAMLGGVAGHAGLFGNATDVAAYMQLLLQHGEYGGLRYFNKETVELFTSCAYCNDKNRRGLGFDRPAKDNNSYRVPSADVSQLSYGHTGFTGTMVWNDPAEKLVFVFLSNRICPDIGNDKIIKLGIRAKVQQVVYDALKNPISKEKRSNNPS